VFYAGSTTYQPGDTLGNTTMTLYQRTWTPDLIQAAINENNTLKDAFDMDPTVGRDVIFQAALRTPIRLYPFPGPINLGKLVFKSGQTRPCCSAKIF
jgi:hypothetical protein